MFLRVEARADILNAGNRLALFYAKLSAHFASIGEKLFKMSPKVHLFIHLCLTVAEAGSHMNPRYFWTYADEDILGQIVDIAHTCHARTISAAVMYKWLVLVFSSGE